MKLLPHVELATGEHPRGTVIWLHGLGADGWDFVPLVRELPLPQDFPLRFIFPHAPVQAVTVNNGYEMPAWYDIKMNDIARVPDERGIRASQQAVGQFIARERTRGVDSRHIVLAGFSQGGAIALQAGLRYPEKLGGILALSTYLTLQESLAAEASPANRATPIFMAHGTEDPIIPLSLAESSAAALEAHGFEVEWHTYRMPHSVAPEEVEAAAQFLVRILGGGAAAVKSSILLP